jgi:hypothetical protein
MAKHETATRDGRSGSSPTVASPRETASRNLPRAGDAVGTVRDAAPRRAPPGPAADVVYVYTILAAEAAGAAALDRQPLRGLAQTPVRLLVEGPLAAAVSPMPAAEFEDIPLNGGAPDLRWLAPRARAHHTVNDRLFERTAAVIPLSFGRAIFGSEEAVRQFLRREQAGLLARLTRVRDRAEWVLSVRRDQGAALAYLEQASPQLQRARARERARAATGRPGHAYLRQQRLGKVQREELARLDGEATQAILSALEPRVERAFSEPLIEGMQSEVLARASVLVPRTPESGFLEAVKRIREQWQGRGYEVAVSGPWPPYRFAGQQAEEAPDSNAHSDASTLDGTGVQARPGAGG